MSVLPVIDGHNDVLMNLYLHRHEPQRDFFVRSASGHLDLPRAREGGFAGGFFAVYVPADLTEGPQRYETAISAQGNELRIAAPLDPSYAQRTAIGMLALLFRLEAASRGQLMVVRAADELAACMQAGVLGAIAHFEGAEPIDRELEALEVFYQAGLRSLGLVWSRPNIFAHGVPFSFPHSADVGPGLSEAGRDLVRACNRLGILIDLSHLNEKGFWDVASLSQAPLVATHSNAHAICPSTRNLSDRQLDAIRDSDGMVGLNFSVGDLRQDGRRDADTPIIAMVQHLDYLVERLGSDRVGFGSDFDGTTISSEIGDAAGLPRLVQALAAHGYDEATLRKLTHENWLRVLRKTWRA